MSRSSALRLVVVAVGILTLGLAGHAEPAAPFEKAHENGRRFETAVAACDRLMRVWLEAADPKTGLLPERLPGPGSGLHPGEPARMYTPHNSGADLYPYLILTADLTDPDLYHGRMMEMLRNEIRYTTVQESIPADLNLSTGALGPPSLFGAGEYAKDGLLAVTEYLGRTPYYARMLDMVVDAMNRAPVDSRFGKLPASDAELNGDYLQVLARLGPMTGDRRFVEWARRIADAYLDEVIPGSHGVPSGNWDFSAHKGNQHLRLRDHGNELVVGLVLQFANEHYWQSDRAAKWQPIISTMLDRILESANSDGLLYNDVSTDTMKPDDDGLSDNWGYIYGAVYTYYQVTGETKYRDAVIHVLKNLTKYRKHNWEPRNDPGLPLGSFDGYADTIESAIYLVNREPVPDALNWIESEMRVMLGMQRPDGHIEYWYGEGNFNRTALLYAYMQSQGVRPEHWQPGMAVGAVRDRDQLFLDLTLPSPTRIQFDYARHSRDLNLDKNYVRLNEFPEWFVVDEDTLYRLHKDGASGEDPIRLGSELVEGVMMEPGRWTVAPIGKAPYAKR